VILILLSFLLRAFLVGSIALVALAMLRRRSAATQHAVAASALIATLALVPASLIFTGEPAQGLADQAVLIVGAG
jgi:hypothetical protein